MNSYVNRLATVIFPVFFTTEHT